jgi:hypothetical protein
MLEILLYFIAEWLHVITAAAVLVFVVVSIVAFGTLALASRRASITARHRFGPIVFRFPLVRLRLRLWHSMAAILVLGALLELGIEAWRAFHAYEKARYHAHSASSYRSMQERGSLSNFLPRLLGLHWDPWMLDYFRAMESYHERISQKYYGVACHPWRSVSSDPPEPSLEEALQREFGVY